MNSPFLSPSSSSSSLSFAPQAAPVLLGPDPVRAGLWAARVPACSPWLHEEVGQRLAARLDCLRLSVQGWCHVAPMRGGLDLQRVLEARFGGAVCYLWEEEARLRAATQAALTQLPGPLAPALRRWEAPQPQSVDLVFCNMALHLHPDPVQVLQLWLSWLRPGGVLLFSCLGVRSLAWLHALYAQQGWGSAGHVLPQMQALGDLLLQLGYADPVVDVEMLLLVYPDMYALVRELRALGRNLSAPVFEGLRSRAWGQNWRRVAAQFCEKSDKNEPLLPFELLYGHAVRPLDTGAVADGEGHFSVEAMRRALRERAVGPKV